jgi:hypothetical protein
MSKDILRASQLALLDQKNKHVVSDLLKVSSGQRLTAGFAFPQPPA